MGIPVLMGRDFGERDDARALPVLMVNQAFARKYFPGRDVIGKRIQPGAGAPPLLMREIVGVVGDARQAVLGTDSDPIYYFPYKQLPWRIGTIVLRTAVPPLELAPAAREVLASLDRAASMSQIRTGEGLSAAVTAPARLVTVLMSSFAALALLLTWPGCTACFRTWWPGGDVRSACVPLLVRDVEKSSPSCGDGRHCW